MRFTHLSIGTTLQGAIIVTTLFSSSLATTFAAEGLAPLLSNEEAWAKNRRAVTVTVD